MRPNPRCGTLCAFGVDTKPPITNAGWGECEPGGTLDVGGGCKFLCDEGFVSYSGAAQPGQPHAACTAVGRSVQLEFVGQCVDPACIDHGDWCAPPQQLSTVLVALCAGLC